MEHSLSKGVQVGDWLSGARIVEAHSAALGPCHCGCKTVKLIYLDAQGAPISMAGFTLEEWVKFNREMMRAFLDSAFDEGVRPT